MKIRVTIVSVALPLMLLFALDHGAHAVVPPPVPNPWVSIGPRRVTSPPVPALGIGQYDAVGRLGPIAVDPTNPQVIYVASAGELGHEGCGVWKTVNGGSTWTAVSDNLPTLAVAAIALDPTNSQRVYIVVADFGLFRSDDGGANWVPVTSQNLKVRRNTADGDWTVLLINPQNPQQMFLTSDDGVRRSTDAGQTWSTVLSGRASALVMDPVNPVVLYAALNNDGVYKTTNGGDGWTPVLYNNRYKAPHGMLLALSHFIVTRDGFEVVYALTGSESTPGGIELWRSADGAASWASVFTCETQLISGVWRDPDACDSSILGVDRINPNIVYFGGPILRVSLSGGANVQRVPSTPGFEDRQPAAPHGDYHGLAIDPLDAKVLYAATDGGIYRSSNRGLTGSWTFIGEGITNVEIYDLAQAATLPGRLIAGTQDNGNILYRGSPVWPHIYPQPVAPLQSCSGCGGDGGRVAIDPNNADAIYVMGQFQDSLQRSADAGGSFADFSVGLPHGTICAAYNATFDLQVLPTTPSIQLASCNALWARMLTSSWTPVFTPDAGSRIVHTARDASINVLYAGGSDGRVYAGLSGGALWRTVFTPAPKNAQFVSDIEVDPAHPEAVYVSFAPPFTVDRNCALAQPRVYQLVRSDIVPIESSVTATDITGNLKPGLCVNALAIDPHQPVAVYAATSKGVYQGRPPAGGVGAWNWTGYNSGMPPADVRDLEFQPITRHLYAATYGRGAFERIPDSLTATKLGSGGGTVTANIGGVSCGRICRDTYADGTRITITATPDRSSEFTGWLGPCTGVGACNFTIKGSTTVTATFAAAPVGTRVLSITGNAGYDALTDGLLALRYLFGLSGAELITGAVGTGATRTTASAIGSYLADIEPFLDIDGNGQADAFTDGLLIIRYMFGLRGAPLLQGALGADATRTSAADIEAAIQSLMP